MGIGWYLGTLFWTVLSITNCWLFTQSTLLVRTCYSQNLIYGEHLLSFWNSWILVVVDWGFHLVCWKHAHKFLQAQSDTYPFPLLIKLWIPLCCCISYNPWVHLYDESYESFKQSTESQVIVGLLTQMMPVLLHSPVVLSIILPSIIVYMNMKLMW